MDETLALVIDVVNHKKGVVWSAPRPDAAGVDHPEGPAGRFQPRASRISPSRRSGTSREPQTPRGSRPPPEIECHKT
jgi:hypothetical protein